MSHVTLRMRLSLFITRTFVANCGDNIHRKVILFFLFSIIKQLLSGKWKIPVSHDESWFFAEYVIL
jgi:hypothetical protein